MDINEKQNDPDQFRCYNCGKQFKRQTEFDRHKNRKTPCLIRDISDADKKNPNRCIYCNKIFSTNSNLNKHLKVCKTKNGGIHILYEKVKHEETIRIMKEEQERKNKEQEQINKELREEIQHLREQLANNNTVINNNNTVNTTNNTINITNVNVIDNYDKPNYSYIVTEDEFRKIFADNGVQTPLALVGRIWFNPEHPENISIHVINTKTGDTLVRVNGEWVIDKQHSIASRLRTVAYSILFDTVVKYFSDPKKYPHENMIVENIGYNYSQDKEFSENEVNKFASRMVDGRRVSANNPAIKHELSARKGMQLVATADL